MKRYGLVRNARRRREAEAYLPDNYRVIWEGEWNLYDGDPLDRKVTVYVIEGEDSAGWTLDGYVIPRYASGVISCEEIDLSHPIMKLVPSRQDHQDLVEMRGKRITQVELLIDAEDDVESFILTLDDGSRLYADDPTLYGPGRDRAEDRALARALYEATEASDDSAVLEAEGAILERLGVSPDETEQGLTQKASDAIDAFLTENGYGKAAAT